MPTCLTPIELLGLSEVRQVAMVGPDLKGVLSTHQILTPVGQSIHDSKEFRIMNLIIPFGGGESFRTICNQIPFAINQLRQDTACGILGTVSFHAESVNNSCQLTRVQALKTDKKMIIKDERL